MKPRTTFTELSQPPLLGRFFKTDGNQASSVKGSAKATAKAPIVTIGDQNSPEVDFISTVPTIGPVHENDTRTSVSAMKNIPRRPPLSAP